MKYLGNLIYIVNFTVILFKFQTHVNSSFILTVLFLLKFLD